MSLISLLLSLGGERVLSASQWQFKTYFTSYLKFAFGFVSKDEIGKSHLNVALLAVLPSLLVWSILWFVEETIIEFVLITLGLIVCFGCAMARQGYKDFLNAAMRGDEVAVAHHQMALQQDQAGEQESFGQTLVWFNYQYYMAIILIFIFLGLPAVVFYRGLLFIAHYQFDNDADEQALFSQSAIQYSRDILLYIDFIPTRFVAFGYMLVGHFSKASTVWLEGLLDFGQSPRQYLTRVAKTSEDLSVDQSDLTSEATLLVQLAKRNLLLLLAATAFMTIAGVLP
ncbi:regulatory signaling modulator protein AmpE [Thalassotalea aquiviva]|uniref:regulatory signaling modulator protein AmpE n=1 Tax=Thalassotalea aquiviva TaxID=3242415 RepID=UPI00352A807A